MALSFEEKLQNYARLLVRRGMNIQPDEFVMIMMDSSHLDDLAVICAEESYRCGARNVHIVYTPQRLKHAQLILAPKDHRYDVSTAERVRFEQIVDAHGSTLSLRSNPYPHLFDLIPREAGDLETATKLALKRFYDEGINKGKVSWCVACPASMGAAQEVYPHVSPTEALNAYWDAIFRMTMADRENCLEKWDELGTKLDKRAKALTALRIATLFFKGPGTDLSVGLSTESQWIAAKKETARGKPFTANVPSFEVFTTPDWRKTSGSVQITRPFNIASVLVEGLTLEFREGKIVHCDATRNREAYQNLIAKDEGASRLGEVALVGTDSPVFKEGVSFRNTLYDENAACHVATGFGYATCIKNGWNMSLDQLRELGRNDSVTHNDVMVSSERVDVDAVTYNGEKVALLRGGRWVEMFA